MLDGLQLAARLGQYAVLLTLFGLSAFGLYSPGAAAFLSLRRLLRAGVAAGVIACLFGLVAQTGEMSGALSDAVKPDMLWTIISATHYGAAWVIRLAALALAGLVLWRESAGSRTSLVLTLHLSGLAIASLAWGGHAAGGEGLVGFVHLAADIVHLWAAGLWVGALAAFCLLVQGSGAGRLQPTAQALASFAGLGSVIAGVLVLTGAVNTAFLVPLHTIPALPGNHWARVLALKLLLFAGMLALAATNRFLLTPRLTRALSNPASEAEVIRRLRLSLFSETSLVFGVLALVAWLGMLHPPSHGG